MASILQILDSKLMAAGLGSVMGASTGYSASLKSKAHPERTPLANRLGGAVSGAIVGAGAGVGGKMLASKLTSAYGPKIMQILEKVKDLPPGYTAQDLMFLNESALKNERPSALRDFASGVGSGLLEFGSPMLAGHVVGKQFKEKEGSMGKMLAALNVKMASQKRLENLSNAKTMIKVAEAFKTVIAALEKSGADVKLVAAVKQSAFAPGALDRLIPQTAVGAGLGAVGGAIGGGEDNRMSGALRGAAAGGLLSAGGGALMEHQVVGHPDRYMKLVQYLATHKPALGATIAGGIAAPTAAGYAGGRMARPAAPAKAPEKKEPADKETKSESESSEE